MTQDYISDIKRKYFVFVYWHTIIFQNYVNHKGKTCRFPEVIRETCMHFLCLYAENMHCKTETTQITDIERWRQKNYSYICSLEKIYAGRKNPRVPIFSPRIEIFFYYY